MYVCICNAVTEDAVHRCVADGARSIKEVRAAVGMKPACGSCTRRLCDLVGERRTALEAIDAAVSGPPLLAAPDLRGDLVSERRQAPLTAA
ncbi:hypothetical protein DPM19_25850 [Actinomadura craniellae]|uniref:Bacterioferritin-associated ferredoxin n=1 Tax=Actinomadura craniellae TaxID=2231787 RepID=A0A365H1S5_9ACTN|nr:(2Fe-2S)-binding protein [Actinomadura craniellae]RAY12153.1 hypothetical protein DPM19_25850 [Actinomadura craniellae]